MLPGTTLAYHFRRKRQFFFQFSKRHQASRISAAAFDGSAVDYAHLLKMARDDETNNDSEVHELE